MIRTLTMIAVAGFLLSAVCLSVAVGLAGPEAVASGAWAWAGPNWDMHWGPHHAGRWSHGSSDGPQATRDLVWSGGDSLEVNLPAEVRFTQGDGPAKLVVHGPQDVIDHVIVDHGRILFDRLSYDADDITIELTAPKVTHFVLSGSGKLDIQNYKQDALAVRVSGDGDVTAQGSTKSVALDISGSGDADLAGLATEGADVRISGSGQAKLRPKTWAKLDISGSGDVTLLSHPSRLETHVSGSGQIDQDDGAPDEGVSASPSPSPSLPARPART